MENEIRDLITEFGVLRDQILEAIQGLDNSAANWRPMKKDTNSIYAVISHIIGAQNNWVRKIISKQEIQRDREAEFRATGDLKEIVERFKKESLEIENILARLDRVQLTETRQVSAHPQGEATVRWCILHVLTHNAIHLGHIQLTRQVWEQRNP
jgi:uncharacterized damage-inducible protein DinB